MNESSRKNGAISYAVNGMTCAGCAARLRDMIQKLDGVESCSVDHAAGTLTVFPAARPPDRGALAKTVRAAGFELAAPEAPRSPAARAGFGRFMLTKPEYALTMAAGVLATAGLALALFDRWIGGQSARDALYGLAIALGGWPVARAAFRETILGRRLGINALMMIAVAGALAIGEWAEAAVVVVLFSLGEALEGYAAERARGAIEALLELAPPVALRLCNGKTVETPVEALRIGDEVLARPGDRIAVDGIVARGHSAVDQAMVTGESMPVEKGPGDSVFAGTINHSGALEIETVRLAADDTLHRMVALVREARANKAPVQRFIDRFARIYTPSVAAAALAVAAIPPLLFQQPFLGPHGWMMRALQMLVIACPCALVVSVPVSLVSAMANAASRGVLIKGGRCLDALARIRVFAFDKTGTLTQGRPVVTDSIDICACGECEPDCGLRHAAALEARSSHPLARAIVAEAEARRIEAPAAENVGLLAGRGVEGMVEGRRSTAASHAHFDEWHPHDPAICRQAEDLAAQGKTAILVSHEGELCGLLGVADAVRPESRWVVESLRRISGARMAMLTGDARAAAEAIARQTGIDEIRRRWKPPTRR